MPCVCSQMCLMYHNSTQGCGLAVTTAPNPDASLPGNEATQYTYTATFSGMSWSRGAPGDSIKLRGYTPLVYGKNNAYDLHRSSLPEEDGLPTSAFCLGTIPSQQQFGSCCDNNSQCSDGLTCDTNRRVCSLPCSSSADCGNYTSPLYGKAVCNTDDDVSYCNADTAYGWSFAGFCRVCKSDRWLGDKGPVLPSQGSSVKFLTKLKGLLGQFCEFSPFLGSKCQTSITVINAFLAAFADTCSYDPVADNVCQYGLTLDALGTSLFILLRLDPETQDLSQGELEQAALQALFYATTANSAGMSVASNEIDMAITPSTVLGLTPPPQIVRIGNVFEVSVYVAISTGGALPNCLVTANIAPVQQGGLRQSVESFVRKVSGDPPSAQASWVAPQFMEGTASAITDTTGVARFQLKLQSAQSGYYTLGYTAQGESSTRTVPFQVVNELANVTIVSDTESWVVAPKKDFPLRVQLDTPLRVQLVNMYGTPMTGKITSDFNVYVRKVVDTNVVESAKTFKSQWASLSPLQRLTGIANLAMQGGRRLSLIPEPAANVDVFLGEVVEEDGGTGVYSFPNLRFVYAKPGTFQFIVVVNSVTSSFSEDMVINYKGALTSWEQAQQYLVTWAMFLFTLTIFVGNSSWHDAKALGVSVAICVAGIILVAFGIQLRSTAQAGLLYFLYSFAVLICGFLAWRQYRFSTALDFATLRMETYFAYVRGMFNGKIKAARQQEREVNEAARKLAIRLAKDKAEAKALKQKGVKSSTSSGWVSPSAVVVQGGLLGSQTPELKDHAMPAMEAYKDSPAWTMCAVCAQKPPAFTCKECHEVFCDTCHPQVHRGRLAAHQVLRGINEALLPSPNAQVTLERKEEADAYLSLQRSYVRALKRTWSSSRAQLRLMWDRMRGRPVPLDLLDVNPDVRARSGVRLWFTRIAVRTRVVVVVCARAVVCCRRSSSRNAWWLRSASPCWPQ